MRRKVLLCSAAVSVIAWNLVTNGASAADDAAALQEVTVTANKRAEDLQDVSTSIAAVTGEELAELNIKSTTDVAKLVPGLQVLSPNSNSDNFFSIRGVGQNDFSEHQEGPVAVYLDGVYQSQATGTGTLLFDTARVEVDRGPQGTLFGRNATGGLVQYMSVAPAFTPDGYVSVTTGSYGQARVESALGGPIIDNKLAARISVDYNHADPFLTNTLGNGKNPDNQADKAAKLQLLATPIDDLEMLLSLRAGGTKVDTGFYTEIAGYADPNNHLLGTAVPANVNIYGTCPGCDPYGYRNQNRFYTGSSDYIGHNYASTAGGTLDVKYHLGDYTLTAISDLTHFSKDYGEDTDGTPNNIATYHTFVSTSQFSQEARIDNGSSGKDRWVAGAYFLDIDGGYREDVSLGIDAPPDGVENPYKIETKSWAAFGQNEIDITDRLTAITGLRWSHDDKTEDYSSYHFTGATINSPRDATLLRFNPSSYGDLAKISSGDWSARAALNYHLTDQIMPYLSWNRGIKSGGFNAPTFATELDPTSFKFHGERINAYEAGVKSEFFDRKARINADAFYYDYGDYQAFQFNGVSQFVFNTQAQVKGGEVEMTLAPVAGLRIGLGTALLEATADHVLLPDGTPGSVTLPQSPRLSQTGKATYTFAYMLQGAITVESDFSYHTTMYYSILNAPIAKQGPIWVQNFHASYTPDQGSWTVGFSAENAFAKEYFNNIIDLASGAQGFGFAQAVAASPQWFSVNLTYHL